MEGAGSLLPTKLKLPVSTMLLHEAVASPQLKAPVLGQNRRKGESRFICGLILSWSPGLCTGRLGFSPAWLMLFPPWGLLFVQAAANVSSSWRHGTTRLEGGSILEHPHP